MEALFGLGQVANPQQLQGPVLHRVGGSLANLVTMTVFISDPRNGDAFVKIRSTMFEAGRYPASALITVSHFARPGIVLEIQGVAVI
jgi:enamine deaminase RidA (YjgF/YER057c/UK114 family)